MGDLVDVASAAIQAVFDDMSVDQATTLENLELLAEEIDTMIEALEGDIAQQDQLMEEGE